MLRTVIYNLYLLNMSYSCYLIGEDHLVLDCAQVLIENKFEIFGLITDFKPAINWALENEVQHFNSGIGFENILTKSFDYLISVVNSKFLKSDILRLAKQNEYKFS